MKYIIFELSMLGKGSWNGKWTGEDTLYARVRKIPEKDFKTSNYEDLMKQKSFDYNFGDGWCAEVKIYETDLKTTTKILKKSKGFCGYDWMIESIINDGYIHTKST